MGEIADMYRDMEFDYGWDDEFNDDDDREEELASSGIWPAKSGEVYVSDMSDDHLSNALKYIERTNPDSPFLVMLEGEINYRRGRGDK